VEGVSGESSGFFRVGPAEQGKATCFAVRRGDIRATANAYVLFSEHFGDLKRLSLCRYRLGTVGEMLAVVQDGLHGVRRYVSDGVPLLGVGNITEDGIDLTEVNRITPEEHARLAASHVRRGDLLVTITGRLGTAAIYPSDAPANLSAHVALCRAKPGYELLYLKYYLASRFGAASLTRAQIGSTHPHINVRRLAELPIPLPGQNKQKELAAAMESAREARRTRLTEADSLLNGLDGFMQHALGAVPVEKDGRKVFAITQAKIGARLDPHFYLPAFAQKSSSLKTIGSEQLGDIVTFSNEVWNPELHDGATFRYIEISAINLNTGEAIAEDVPVAHAPNRARMLLRDKDIIVSLTRPHHGAIARINASLAGSVASTGFAVIREVDESKVSRDYLWCILRSRLCLDQMLQRASGGNYPAITEAELSKVLVPVPEFAVQKQITTEAQRRGEDALQLRTGAETEWRNVQRWFEDQLLGQAK